MGGAALNFFAQHGHPAIQRDALTSGFDGWDLNVIIGLASKLRLVRHIGTTMLAMIGRHVAFMGRVGVNRPMRTSGSSAVL